MTKNKTTKILLTFFLATSGVCANSLFDPIGNATTNLSEMSGVDIRSAINNLDIANMDLASLTTALSFECTIDINPPFIPPDICSNLNDWRLSYSKTFNLGNCSVTAGASAGSEVLDNMVALANDVCNGLVTESQRVFNIQNSLSMQFIDSKSLRIGRGESSSVGIYSNGTTTTEIKDEIFSLDSLLSSDKKNPPTLTDSVLYDNYQVYSMYERFAKTTDARNITEVDGKKRVDFTKLEPKVNDTVEEYDKAINLKSMQLLSMYQTPYELEKYLQKEALRIKSELGSPQGSTSSQLKQSYMQKKQDLIKRLTTESLEDAKQKMENYLIAQFQEQEDSYRRNNSYIVNPTNAKVMTRKLESRLPYANRIFIQQEEETRRKTEFLVRKKKILDSMSLLAEKVAIESFEYNPSIVEKEIEELLSGVSGGGSSGGGGSIGGINVSSDLGF